jgi:hypothetical protein
MHEGRLYNSGGWNGGLNVVKSLLTDYSSVPYAFYALRYPAAGATYGGSVGEGVNNLVTEINFMVEQCGNYTPAIILLGYSQGADVVSQAAMSSKLTNRAKGAILAVADVANPHYSPFQPYNAPGAATGGSGRLGQYNDNQKGTLAGMKYWGFPPPGGSQGWVYRVRSWCTDGDQWCASGNGPNAGNIHADAMQNASTAVKDWIDYMATSF